MFKALQQYMSLPVELFKLKNNNLLKKYEGLDVAYSLVEPHSCQIVLLLFEFIYEYIYTHLRQRPTKTLGKYIWSNWS